MALFLQGVDTNSSAYNAGQLAAKVFLLVLAGAIVFRVYKWIKNR
jgi:hypothetical protein